MWLCLQSNQMKVVMKSMKKRTLSIRGSARQTSEISQLKSEQSVQGLHKTHALLWTCIMWLLNDMQSECLTYKQQHAGFWAQRWRPKLSSLPRRWFAELTAAQTKLKLILSIQTQPPAVMTLPAIQSAGIHTFRTVNICIIIPWKKITSRALCFVPYSDFKKSKK